jgi:hypothetical protein
MGSAQHKAAICVSKRSETNQPCGSYWIPAAQLIYVDNEPLAFICDQVLHKLGVCSFTLLQGRKASAVSAVPTVCVLHINMKLTMMTFRRLGGTAPQFLTLAQDECELSFSHPGHVMCTS